MHELSLAQALIERIREEAHNEQALSISRVTVIIGDYSGVEPEAFAFAFPLAAQDSPAEGAELQIERSAAQARCAACRALFEPDPAHPVICPECGSPEVSVTGGREFLIRSIELELP